MDYTELFRQILEMGQTGVGFAQLITMVNPASWWASGILYIIEMFLSALAGNPIA